MPAKIVIGFDGTDSGEDALALGLLLARATGAVPVVAVVHPQEYPIGVGRVDAEWVAYMHEQAEELLGRARRLLGAERGADYREVSAPSESRGLHELAEQEQAELVVVGSSHRGPLGRTYPGSTGDRLLQGSACPVAVAPRGLRESPPDRLGTIAVAYLDTPEAHQALDAAVELAGRVRARLRLVSVMPRPAEIFMPVVGRDAEEAFMATTREVFQRALAEGLARVGGRVEADAELLEGGVVDTLATLDRRDADLLVCGSRSYGPLRRVLLGGVSSRLLRRSALPLLVVPRSGNDDGA
ncbi:MAG TPA: universal stress protein [Actinomycetota bacterium]|nr:universal stress protein [Actinomycetota bacterium]